MALVVSVWLFREPLRQQIRQSATLANDAPTPEVVSDMIEHAADPRAALLAAWNSGKIVHREVAIRSLTRVLPAEQPLPPEFDSLLLSAALDPDMNVRESALGILRERHHPALAALAAEQLHNFDQHESALQVARVTPCAPWLEMQRTARTGGKNLRTHFFFLSPRRRSRERTEERGCFNSGREKLLLSPALSSIRWRRGSGCGFAERCPLVSIRGFNPRGQFLILTHEAARGTLASWPAS